MKHLRIGFARKDITPALGCCLSGYFETRCADGIIDPLLGTAIAADDGNKVVLVYSLDLIGIFQQNQDMIRQAIADETGIPYEAIMITCTHTHLGPVTTEGEAGYDPDVFDPSIVERLKNDLILLAKDALNDRKPAEMYVAENHVHDVSFIRAFRMKDGSIETNPGWQNPNIVEPITKADDHLGLILFKRENAPEIAIINFQVHPDVIGGTKFSADYPKFVRDTFENIIPNSRCMYINGAMGDSNHIDVSQGPGTVRHGYQRAIHMGRCIAGAAISVYALAQKSTSHTISYDQRDISLRTNKGTPEEIEEAKRVYDLWKSGQEDKILPPEEAKKGMAVICKIAKADRIMRLLPYPDWSSLHLGAIAIGDLVIAAIPGEPVAATGMRFRAESGFRLTIAACCGNGYEDSYLPRSQTYDDGGYEPTTAIFVQGETERVEDEFLKIMHELRKEMA